MTTTVSLEELSDLATRALVAANTSSENARIVAAALVAADADGLSSHGVSRIPFYADQVLSGKVDGNTTPDLQVTARASIAVDAKCGVSIKDVPNLILTPHIAGVTEESNVRVSSMVATGVRRVLERG